MTEIASREAAFRRPAAGVHLRRTLLPQSRQLATIAAFARAASVPVLQTWAERMDPVYPTLVGAPLAKARFCLDVRWHPEYLPERRSDFGSWRPWVEAAHR